LVHLLYFLVGSASSVLARGIVVSGDSAATMKNLLAHESLYRSGIEVGILANAVYIVLTVLFFVLFEPVSRRMSLIAAFFGLAGCVVQLFGAVFQAAPLVLLNGASSAGSIAAGSMPAAVRLALKLYSETYNVSLVLFALFDLSIGWLVFKSRFLPRILGIAMMLAGVVAATFLWPPFALAHLAVILSLGGIAELALMLWLIVKGVDGTKWRERRAGAVP
jgi:hypothetical protein